MGVRFARSAPARATALALTAVLALALTACGAESGPPVAVPTASLAPAESLLVPSKSVPGLHLEHVDGQDQQRWTDPSRVAIYGEPGVEEPGAGRLLLAAYAEGSDIDHGLPDSGTYGTDTWRTWKYADDTDQETDTFGVMGRALTGDELDTARDAAVGDPKRGLLIGEGGVPEGLAPLGTLPVRVSDDRYLFGAPSLTWSNRSRGATLSLTMLDADPALVRTLVRGERIQLRNSTGVVGVPVGTPRSGEKPTLWVWSEGDAVAVVQAERVAREDVDAFIASLEPAGTDARDALRDTVVDYPSEWLVPFDYTDARIVASGRTKTAMWVLWLMPGKGGRYLVGEAGLHTRYGMLGGGSGDVNLSALDKQGLIVSIAGQDHGTLVSGAVVPEAVKVRIAFGKGEPVTVPVQHTTDPRAGWYGYWAEGAGDPTSLTAYDAAGRRVAHHPG